MNVNLFEGIEHPLKQRNGDPIIEQGFQFTYDDCGTETAYDFPNYSSAYMVVYNERGGRVIKTLTMERTGDILYFMTQDTTYEDLGKYFYEVIYMQTGGYEYVLMYGTLTVI